MATQLIEARAPINAQFPEKLQFLFEPHRYKVAYGGRGGAKSWGFARALLLQGAQRPLRIPCARETQKSIADSVHKLLSDQIAALGLEGFYRIEKARILGANGTEFTFHGLKHNVAEIKSLEGADIMWVEEAQSVSKASWDVVTPTIRKDGSEIWVSFNPDLETDDTYRRFVIEHQPGSVVVKINWNDNPWFPEVLRIEKDHAKEKNYKAYLHVWEGECKSAVDGAIYEQELLEVEREGRFCQVSYDRTRPVHTFWDLGFDDTNSIWFAQEVNGWFNVIDYIENRGKTIEWYLIQIQQKQYMQGPYWLPWDGLKQYRKLGSGRSAQEIMQAAGCNVRFVTMLPVRDGINAVRMVLPQCRFDKDKCADGIQGLRHYQWGPPDIHGQARREPLHNWASHPADAFRYLATAMKGEPPPEREVKFHRFEPRGGADSWMA